MANIPVSLSTDSKVSIDSIISALEVESSTLPWFLRLKSLYECIKFSVQPANVSNPLLVRCASVVHDLTHKISAAAAPLFDLGQGEKRMFIDYESEL